MRHRGKTYWRKRRDKLLKKHVDAEGKVLDIGCGWRVYSGNAVRLDVDPGCNPDVVADIQKGIDFLLTENIGNFTIRTISAVMREIIPGNIRPTFALEISYMFCP